MLLERFMWDKSEMRLGHVVCRVLALLIWLPSSKSVLVTGALHAIRRRLLTPIPHFLPAVHVVASSGAGCTALLAPACLPARPCAGAYAALPSLAPTLRCTDIASACKAQLVSMHEATCPLSGLLPVGLLPPTLVTLEVASLAGLSNGASIIVWLASGKAVAATGNGQLGQLPTLQRDSLGMPFVHLDGTMAHYFRSVHTNFGQNTEHGSSFSV